MYYRVWRQRNYVACSQTYVQCESVLWAVDDGTGARAIVAQCARFDEDSYHDAFGEDTSYEISGMDPLEDATLLGLTNSSRGVGDDWRWQCEETVVEKGELLYVIGQVKVVEGQPYFDNVDGELFIAKSREELLRDLGVRMLYWMMVSIIVLIATLGCGLYGMARYLLKDNR